MMIAAQSSVLCSTNITHFNLHYTTTRFSTSQTHISFNKANLRYKLKKFLISRKVDVLIVILSFNSKILIFTTF